MDDPALGFREQENSFIKEKNIKYKIKLNMPFIVPDLVHKFQWFASGELNLCNKSLSYWYFWQIKGHTSKTEKLLEVQNQNSLPLVVLCINFNLIS